MTEENGYLRVARRWLQRSGSGDLVVYIAAFLPSMEKQRLLKKFPPIHPVVHADHMTVWYFEEGGEAPAMPFGKMFPLKVVGTVEDDKAQVAILKVPTIIRPYGLRTPHITISTVPGVQPVYSNQLIDHRPNNVAQAGLPTLKGRLGWWDGQKQRF